MIRSLTGKKIILALIMLIFITSYCKNNNDSVSRTGQYSGVRDGVKQMMDSIARNVSEKGPVAWLQYFENTPDFFMASDGQLDFSNKDSASSLINNTIVKQIKKIDLNWNNIHIDGLSGTLAAIAADFHEDITDSNGYKSDVNGYFTGIAHRSVQGWQLRNLHWSIKKETPK
jgi:hypothetical protein